jgi:hypothetical protein
MSSELKVISCRICVGGTHVITFREGIGRNGVVRVDCPNCGTYSTSGELIEDGVDDVPAGDRVRLSSWIRERWRRGDSPLVLRHDIDVAVKSLPRLGPAEKANRLLLTLAHAAGEPGTPIQASAIVPADAWASNKAELNLYRNWLVERGFIRPFMGGDREYDLTLPGWIEVDRLRSHQEAIGNRAFMAMQYGDSELDQVVSDHFAPAVTQAGFELRRLDHKQPAGLIDDQMRVGIRTAKILICDLTHGNKGAYWEAGFAEGIGRPVIFMCREDVFRDSKHPHRPHFDTNHMKTILWSPANPQPAADALKLTIRATLPADAKLED